MGSRALGSLLFKKIRYLEAWTIHDFYNPGLKYGGKIHVKLYGFWFPSLEGHNEANKTTILERNANPTIRISDAEKQSDQFKLNKQDWHPNEEKFRDLCRWRIYLLGDAISQRRNLEGITIDSVVAITNKIRGNFMAYLSTPFDVEMDTMHRHNYILYQILMEMYNFKTIIQRTNSWGYIKNGSWTGVIGVLVRNEAELAITPTQFKSERFHIVDQTAITWLARPALIFRHPSKDSGLNEDSFTEPLEANVWWATIGVLAIVTLLMRTALRHEARFLEQDHTQHSAEIREDDSWNYTLLLALPGALFQQGVMHNPTIPSGRIISLFLLIFTFILYQFYSASIVSSLLSEPPRTINTIADLLRSELKVVIEDIPYNYDFFETTTDPVALELYKRKVIPKGTSNNFMEPKIGLEKVRKGGYAFQIDVATAYKMIPETFSERAVCELAEIQLFPPKPVVTITRKYSPYREIITKGLRKMHESGILRYQRAVWHHPRPECPPSAQSGIGSVTITAVATALILLAAGAALAFFIFAWEAVVARRP